VAWRPDALAPATTTLAWLTRPSIRFRPRLAPSVAVAGLAFGVYIVVAAIFVLGSETIVGDAFSRVGNAYYILFSRDPHLAAIGFVWNPLPALATLPLLPFSEIWPPLVTRGFAGNIVSALFMAAAVRQIWLWCRDLGLGTVSTAAATLLFALHPLIVLYGANGMSEASFLFFLIFAARQLARWVHTQGVGELVWAGAGLALAYTTRYEAVAAAAAATALTFVAGVTFLRGSGGIRKRAPMALADAIVMGLPFAAAFGAWSLASLIIVGSPFETFTSVYGGSNQIALSIEGIRQATGETPAAALGYAARQIIGLQPLLLPIVGAAALAAVLRRDMRVLAIIAIFGSIILFSLALFLAGKSFGWLRFYIGVVPLGAMAAAYLISLASEPRTGGQSRRQFVLGSALMDRLRIVTAGAASSVARLRSTFGTRRAATERVARLVAAASPHLATARLTSSSTVAAFEARCGHVATRASRTVADAWETPTGRRFLANVEAKRARTSETVGRVSTVARQRARTSRERLATAAGSVPAAGQGIALAREGLASARVAAGTYARPSARAARLAAEWARRESIPTLSAAGSLAAAATRATARGFLIVLTLALLATSVPTGLATVQAGDLAREEAPAIKGLAATVPADMPSERHQYRVARDVATYLDARDLPDGSVVIDVALGFWVVLQSDRPKQFVITPDRDFESVVADPVAFGAKYLLVSPSAGMGSLSLITRTHPGVYENGAGIATLEHEFTSPGGAQHTWRLYRITD
jgi:hypothetical protein